MKKLISLLLALMMVLSLATVTFADDTQTGSITINGVTGGATYEIYKLLDLESYNTASGAYSYTVNADWTAFFATDEAKAYVAIDDAGYVTWKTTEDDPTVAAFAKLALAYAKEHGIDPVKSSENAGEFVITETSGKFSELSLGYYLVDSTMGALCGLTTTNPDASINAKNNPPKIDKQVQEDSTNQWTDGNTADIGQTVNFRTTIDVHSGAQNYVLHDIMSEGLTFDPQSVEVIHINTETGTAGTKVDKTTTVDETTTVNWELLLDENLNDGCTFEVKFSESFCNSLETNDKIIVHYSAMLNRNAVIAGEGNSNEAFLKYGENHTTTHDITKTHTFKIDIVKTDSQNTLIDGAEFRIYDAATDGNEIGVVPLMEADETTPVLDKNGNTVYRRARADEMEAGKNVPIVVKGGLVTVVGFDNGTYYLAETEAPDGYNKLTDRQRFIISDGNLDAVFNGDIFSTGSGVHVVNKTGSMLPETGAMGTTLFFTFGVIVMLATGCLLVTKKRMSMIED